LRKSPRPVWGAIGAARRAAAWSGVVFIVVGLAPGVDAGEFKTQTTDVRSPKKTVNSDLSTKMTAKTIATHPVPFAALPGWEADDHLAAFKAFVASCVPVIAAAKSGQRTGSENPSQSLTGICHLAVHYSKNSKITRAAARAFFEANFTAESIEQRIAPGLLTGYYEPLIKGSRVPTDLYQTPVYRRPPDLVNVVAESERGAQSHKFTHLRQTASGLVPHMTRAEIEQGGLKGQNLELLYFRDPVDVYFMQVQGSARIELTDGEKIRITYDGKNGYPYTSIGRELIDSGTFTPDNMSLKSLANWLKDDRARAAPVMWKNQSYVFFRELKGAEAAGAMGALSIPLQVGRSLAVDTGYHSLGTPIYVSAPGILHAGNPDGFNRLMIAHDVGSAIKGPERGDIFFGSGDKAGKTAGVTKHPGRFYVLRANPAKGPTETARMSP
jgi:membrane-bound lytic murein transglycosylase A